MSGCILRAVGFKQRVIVWKVAHVLILQLIQLLKALSLSWTVKEKLPQQQLAQRLPPVPPRKVLVHNQAARINGVLVKDGKNFQIIVLKDVSAVGHQQ